jgi:glycosyltransferase involved in cell wall biosynthesis
MIVNGRNGFIVQRRDPSAFANAMLDALALENAKIVSLQIAEQYSLNHMKKRLSQLWKPLQIDPESSTLSGQI